MYISVTLPWSESESLTLFNSPFCLQVSNMMTELSPELRATATNEARRGAVADASSTASILAEVCCWVGLVVLPAVITFAAGWAACCHITEPNGHCTRVGWLARSLNQRLTAHIRFLCSMPQAAKVKLGAVKSIVDSNFAPAPVPMAFANTAGEQCGLTGWAGLPHGPCNPPCAAAHIRP